MNTYDKIRKAAEIDGVDERRSEDALWWFTNSIRNINRKKLLRDSKHRRRPTVGQMYMFVYDPKNKKTLPFYDRFPLIFMVDRAPGGFYGLNLHYLPPRVRIPFFLRLLEYSNSRRGEQEKLVLSYNLLKGASKLKAFRHCFKHYLTDHVRSDLAFVSPDVWDIAAMLPSDQFVKKNRDSIWKGIKL